ncbi:PTS fructose transporter subunit IIC [Granulicatella sp. zg-ZJ]|uniref:PTS mannose/fructose/sorbose/N-acetylgalactosamine transporter subunit IIC n=1 Tax=unclassified Granulicatella TaxID=2630493 RepID=UPI0013C141DF|nr:MULTISPECIES: PTS mannose/fructose/sorbose/N-acetylgalactosamine transporter subunit IIC [unclassified Granulicatella]NEW62023.1 PTS fructose transporter subunit IIC [Granulicatella sp. zg-ZJ]NEW66752.1 PTS fructose transporter subunit IIC [Granulicatella sp. zg-84]QMI85968.1 PTS sugar transporter subunit IIC [Carnobacteriaceae bacterium zg-84]
MIHWWQILLLTLYAAYQILDELTIVSSAGSPVFAGCVAGLVMGDLQTGLFIGGSLQLVVLGVGTFGGASRIDANSGAVLATAFSVAFKIDPQQAIATIAVPVATLLIQFDVLGRFLTTFFQHKIDRDIENFNYKAIERDYLLGAFPWALSRALPVFFALALGQGAVQGIIDFINTNIPWLATGLTVAGGALPGVGFAILLRYLPVKKHFPYLILGFVLTAMLSVLFASVQTLGGAVAGLSKEFTGVFQGLPVLGVALIGFALASIHFKNSFNVPSGAVASSAAEGEVDDDEI